MTGLAVPSATTSRNRRFVLFSRKRLNKQTAVKGLYGYRAANKAEPIGEGGKKMNTSIFKKTAAFFVLSALVLAVTLATKVQAQAPAVDPAATKILRQMTDFIGGLQKFTVHTQNTLEDLLESGHRVDFDVSADVVISRPNKLFAGRKGDVVDQIFFYDGKTLSLHNPSDKVYATEPAPGTIEEMLDFARESLGLIVPVADLVYRNAFPLLMQDVNLAVVIGKSVIGGVTCNHLLFSRPGVDFQVWVADSGRPLPYKYVVTDTGTPARLSVTTVISNWNIAPPVSDTRFTFVPPPGAKQIEFMPL
jgi:hypothetical protein